MIPRSKRSQDGSDLLDWQVLEGPLHHCRVANPADYAAQYGAPLQTADSHTLEVGTAWARNHLPTPLLPLPLLTGGQVLC